MIQMTEDEMLLRDNENEDEVFHEAKKISNLMKEHEKMKTSEEAVLVPRYFYFPSKSEMAIKVKRIMVDREFPLDDEIITQLDHIFKA